MLVIVQTWYFYLLNYKRGCSWREDGLHYFICTWSVFICSHGEALLIMD